MKKKTENTPSRSADRLVTQQYAKRSRPSELWHSIKRNKGAVIGLVFIAVLLLVTLFSLIFISYDQVIASSKLTLAMPSLAHPFGTDELGRDLFLRVIYGTRYSLVIGIGSVAIALCIGMVFGAVAGYYGGRTVDTLIMRASDILLSIPGLLLGMVIVTVLTPSLTSLMIAVSIPAIPNLVRITRASVLTQANQEYVEASRAIGMPDIRIIFTHVLPNGLSPVIVMTTSLIGITITVAAQLSFLGFGIPLPTPEWGALVSTGRSVIRMAPHLTYFPGLFIMATVLVFNIIGDGLRDALDPKLKR